MRPRSTLRAYSSGQYQFVLDGDPQTDYIKSVSGGQYKGQVITERVGPSPIAFKHLATVEPEAISIEMGLAVSEPILEWISASWRRNYSRRSGAIIHADFNGKSQLEQWFFESLVTETTFPAFDASSNDAAYLSVKIEPERLELKRGDDKQLRGVVGGQQMQWTTSSFALDIDGIDCNGVNKIDSFTVKQNIKKLQTGRVRTPQIEPTRIEFPDLSIETSLAYADGFMKWYEDTIVKGRRDVVAQRGGSIIVYPQQPGEPLMTITLDHIGITSFEIQKSSAQEEKIKRAKIGLFVGSMNVVKGFALQ